MTVTRRSVLGGRAGLGAAPRGGSTSPPSPVPAPTAAPTAADTELAAIENRFGGRLGIAALDTATGTWISRRGDERFPLCSTGKAPTVAAVLHRSTTEPDLLDRVIHYEAAQIVAGNSPVTRRSAATGLTVGQLCEAALTVSDNTAENLLLALLDGPAAVTAFLRGLGDPVTRLDRIEPDLNTASPGDDRDTTTPTWIVRDLQALTLSDALPAPARDRLVSWMTTNTTGAEQIRAGVPTGWRVADKTGSGAQGESHDIGIVWPPGRPPLVLAVYTAPADPANTTGKATIAAATRTVLNTLLRPS